MRYEEVLKLTGGCGLHRVLVLIFIAIASMRQGTMLSIVIFQLDSPTLDCISVNNSSPGNASIHLKDFGWCRTSVSVDECDEWTYSDPASRKTAVQEWNLCDQQSVMLLAQTAAILAFGIAGSIAANLSDRYGRIRLFAIFCCLDSLAIVGKSFSVNIWMYIAFHAISNGICGGYLTSFYTFVNEIVHPKHRRYFEFVAFITFSVGHCVTSGLAFLTTSWRDLERTQLAFSLSCLLLIATVVRESPKWLLVVNQPKNAAKVLRQMAALNRRPRIDDECLKNIKIATETKTASPIDLFSSKQLVKNAAATTVVTTLTIMVYYIITWNSSSFLQGSIYVNVVIMGLTEMPNSFLFLFLVKFFSKKWLIMAALIICGGMLMIGATITAVSSAVVASKICIFTSRMAANFSHSALYSFVPEVFPTSLRSFGLGLANLGSRLISAPMPYILLTANRDNILIPSLILGGMVILGTMTLICLPNTYACRLPDTLDEARLFKRGSEHLFRIDKLTFVCNEMEDVEIAEGENKTSLAENKGLV